MNRVFLLPLSFVIAFFAIYLTLANFPFFLSVEPGYSIGSVSRWCERISGGYFREPVNALSNLGFIITGLFMFWILSKEPRAKLIKFKGPNLIALLYASAAVFLGPGSLLMHGTHTAWGQWADWLSMIIYISIPWLINIFTCNDWKESSFIKTYLSLITIFALLSWFFGYDLGINFNLWALSIGWWIITEVLMNFWSNYMRLFSGFIAIAVMSLFGTFPNEIINDFNSYWWVILFWLPAILMKTKPVIKRTYNPWFFLGCGFYFIAFIIWLQGYPGTRFCNPDSLIQPHGIWHVLSSFATLSFFFYFRTERSLRND